MKKVIIIKQDGHYSHDGYTLKAYKKGDVITSEQMPVEALCKYVELGIAEFVNEEEAPENKADANESENNEEIEAKAIDEAPENKAIKGVDVNKNKKKSKQ